MADESAADWRLLSRVSPREEAPARARVPAAPPLAILGVPLDAGTLEQTVLRVDQMIASRRPHYIATANVDFLVQARKDFELRRVLMQADAVLCDGTPLVWVSHLLGHPLPERVAGSDLVPRLIEHAVQQKYRLFFLGGAPATTEKAVAALNEKFPGLRIVGHYSPPFSSLLEMDHEEIDRRIHLAQPDIVFVSFGCPKAEKWMAMHYEQLGVPVMIGVGGTIDFLAGEKKRAPAWMRRGGIEWLFRMLQEPRRLARRYAQDFCQFFPAVLRQWWCLRRASTGAGASAPAAITIAEPTWVRLQVPARLDYESVSRDATLGQIIPDRHCLLELANVACIDSTGVAWLQRLHQQLHKHGCCLVLLDPSPAVRRALRLLRLDAFFLAAGDVVQARELILASAGEQGFGSAASSSRESWHCRGEITARNSQALWEQLQIRLLTLNGRQKIFTLDLSGVRFMDTAGLRVLLRAQSFARDLGADFQLAGVQNPLQNILRHAGAERLLRPARP